MTLGEFRFIPGCCKPGRVLMRLPGVFEFWGIAEVELLVNRISSAMSIKGLKILPCPFYRCQTSPGSWKSQGRFTVSASWYTFKEMHLGYDHVSSQFHDRGECNSPAFHPSSVTDLCQWTEIYAMGGLIEIVWLTYIVVVSSLVPLPLQWDD